MTDTAAQPHATEMSAGELTPDNDMPDVTVVIPCFNVADTIEQTVESLRMQPGVVREIIAVNDGSTDRTAQVLEGLGPDVLVVHQENGGACRARNTGLSHARARYVVFLDGDDWLEGHMLHGACQLADRTGADIVLSRQLTMVDGKVDLFRDFFADPVDPVTVFEQWHGGRRVNTASVFWRTSFVRAIGGWDERVLLDQDGELMMRGLLKGAKLGANRHGFSVYNRQRGSISSSITDTKVLNYFETLERLHAMSIGSPFENRHDGLNRIIYKFSRDGLREGHIERGRAGIALMKKLGMKKHFGTARHRALASFLGLEWKMRLWGR